MEKFKKYLGAIDGSSDWATIAPLFDDAFDADCVIVTADGEMNKSQWADMAKGLQAKGAVVSGLTIDAQDDEHAAYRLIVTTGDGEPLEMVARATLRDGRILRVEPADPDVYSDMVERST